MSNYYAKRDAKVNIAHELMNNGWNVFGYKADESDSMTDYYSPANWDGIATKNGFTLVVDTKYTGNSGRVQTKTTTNGSTNYKKIAKLKKMTIENGCTEAEAQAAQDMINKLKNSVKVNEEVISVWPEFMANPKGCIWHIEKEGAIIAKGRSLTIFADVPKSYMFDIKTMKFKGSWKTVRDWNGNTYDRELNEKEAKAVKSFKEFLNKIESVVSVKIGEEQEEDQLVKITEEKKTIKKEKIQVNRENELQVGDIVHVDNSTGYVKILEAFEGHYNTIKVSSRTWKESKSRFPLVNLNKQSFDRSLQRGYLKVYNIVEVEEVTTVEKWVKAKKETKKTTKKDDKAVKPEAATEVEKVTDIKVSEEIEIKLNEEKNGIEIYFTSKPSEEVRTALKYNGFRWSKYNKCWYAKQSEKALNFANSLIPVKEETEEAPEVVADVEEIIKHEIEYTNQVLKEELEEVEREIKPLEVQEAKTEIKINNVLVGRKENNILDIKEYGTEENIIITKYAILSNNDFDYMCNNLLNDYSFLQGYGGTRAEAKAGEDVPENYDINYLYANRNKFNFYEINILITNEDQTKFIVVNPHGHSYARYTGVLTASEGKRALRQLKGEIKDTLQVIESNTEESEDITNVEKCNSLYLEVEALEKRLKMVNSNKLKYKIESQINDKMQEIAKIILSDEILYMQFMKESKNKK